MSEEYTIQCPTCGTHYNDLQDVCPYCGEPQPPDEPAVEEYFIEPPVVDEESPTPVEDFFAPQSDSEPLPDEYSDDAYFPEDTPFEQDDIFAIAHQEETANDPSLGFDDFGDEFDETDGFNEYDDINEIDPPDDFGYFDESDEFDQLLPVDETDEIDEFEDEPAPRRLRFRQVALGCFSFLVCAALFYGGVGILAVRSGLQERSQLAQSESYAHYQKGQELLSGNSIELAIAEFERALKLNPNFSEARHALREAQHQSQLQPTATSQTRTAAATNIFAQAEVQFKDENWAEVVQTLSQVRDLDPDYQPDGVSEMLFAANYQLGLQLANSDQVEEALAAFEEALTENPNDPDVLTEQAKATLYLQGMAALEKDKKIAIRALGKLYQDDENYLDVVQQLQQAYEAFGDELADEKNWCLAESQYVEANSLKSSVNLQTKIKNSKTRCGDDKAVTSIETATPQAKATSPAASRATPGNTTPGSTVTATITITNANETPVSSQGIILYSVFNPNETHWEILSTPVEGGTPKVMATNATMPALSPNGQILMYHSELKNSEGLHAFNLTTGENIRATQFRNNILPRWSGDNLQFIFVAQDLGTGRWQMFQGFADGKSDPIILGDGRTPDWSPDGKTIAFQGTDPLGNNPGIYLMPFGGGESTRLTTHESDRTPVFSPDGLQIAYMSTQNGNWDIYTVSSLGGTPKQITTSSGNDGLPAWSPDGNRIAFVSDRGGSWNIHVTDISKDNPTKVSEWSGSNRADWLEAQIWWSR